MRKHAVHLQPRSPANFLTLRCKPEGQSATIAAAVIDAITIKVRLRLVAPIAAQWLHACESSRSGEIVEKTAVLHWTLPCDRLR
jgi:hypothetical protein